MPRQPRNVGSHADNEILSPSMEVACLIQRRVRFRTTRKDYLHSCGPITPVRKRPLRTRSYSRFPASSAHLKKSAQRIDHGVGLGVADAVIDRQGEQQVGAVLWHT